MKRLLQKRFGYVRFLIFKLFKRAGFYKLFVPTPQGWGAILIFHRIVPRDANGIRMTEMEVSPEFLDYIIGHFKSRGFCIASMNDVHRWLHLGKAPGRFVVFTFDDGYVDNFTHAYPVFKKHNAPFTIYLTSGFPDHTAIIWWYLIPELVSERKVLEFSLEGRRQLLPCRNAPEKVAAYKQLKSLIQTFRGRETKNRILELFESMKVDPFSVTRRLAMTWQQVLHLSRDPLVSIGGHTVNHLVLKNLPDDVARAEILDAKNKIEKMINRPVDHFSYPYGGNKGIGPEDEALVRTCGFKTATTTHQGSVFFANRGAMQSLPRLSCGGEKYFERYFRANLNPRRILCAYR